jgi:hypothetical protein
MHISTIIDFLSQYWLPLGIISIGALIYGSIVTWASKMSISQTLTLFITGIIVITCIFLPFNWSIQNSGTGREVSLFFFQINIEGSNFISILKNSLAESTWVQIIQDFLPERNVAADIITLFLAFLEELAKLTLLILCIRKSLRLPVILVYLFLIYSLYQKMSGMNTTFFMGVMSIFAFIGLIILWILLSKPPRMESVSDYIYSIALVAIGFAFAENIKYMLDLSNAWQSADAILQNAFLRSIFWYLSHTFFSMVCVALYARGRFAFLRLIDDSGNLSLGQKALGWKNYTNIKSIQGFWTGVIVASIIHGIYNIYISTDILVPSVILIVGFLFLELFVLHDLRNNTKYGHIENYMQ